MKTIVYAICKNEEKFVRRWMESMREADGVYVLDTGSTDNTVTLLRELGANVQTRTYDTFRFDTARNDSLRRVPADADICVCTDLDEVFRPGWKAALERVWRSGVTRVKYRYVWSHTPSGGEGVVFLADKIHAYGQYVWKHPVHEVLAPLAGVKESFAVTEDIRLEHFPDDTKSRSAYLPLLELSVAEDPSDDRNTHYLGREYMYRGMWQKAIETLKTHLRLPTAVWADERCASMRYIARCHMRMSEYREAEKWLLRAAAEAPHLREPFMDLADLYYQEQDWYGVLYAARRAESIRERALSYISEPDAWGDRPHDLLSVAYYNVGLVKEALAEAVTAHRLNPSEDRIAENVKLLENLCGQKPTANVD